MEKSISDVKVNHAKLYFTNEIHLSHKKGLMYYSSLSIVIIPKAQLKRVLFVSEGQGGHVIDKIRGLNFGKQATTF